MRNDLLTVAAALAAAAALDNPDDPDRERHLATVTEAAGTVRELAAWLVGDATDALAWALYHHGNLSQDKVARLLGYGREDGGRVVRMVQERLRREQARRVGDVALALVQAARTGPADRLTVPAAPPKVDTAANAAAVAELHAAAAADAETGSIDRTRTALAALADLWGTAKAGGLLGDLGHTAYRAVYDRADDTETTTSPGTDHQPTSTPAGEGSA
ncbi:hypothetical protein [Amycolatopsis keratiniphila]|uniref:Uncharacterized protein n=1 Tax=Amycolatopsis keratiniphila subsp. keratiniphila TaxID=227715 RepID=A0A1W2M315_9PSEU|nr:hypothetical protein [Amycolatopsis keratiniphila]ONF73930.1 hypothetical protein AVR91_0204155 [Amycolatopsis keratiniphila subsp. keratiniphila]